MQNDIVCFITRGIKGGKIDIIAEGTQRARVGGETSPDHFGYNHSDTDRPENQTLQPNSQGGGMGDDL